MAFGALLLLVGSGAGTLFFFGAAFSDSARCSRNSRRRSETFISILFSASRYYGLHKQREIVYSLSPCPTQTATWL